ncbi:glycosyl transferase family 90 [Paracoccus sp. WLY502]|uniref:glycosyl transferase family 90 n=1 Tax=Paracoccus yibinensis TaxID=3068891 RepID=UPI002796A602|nr:glycosyl transferase family 90 [Paracoccus sp. WLY502]MDQ1900381.1 glycosyl transferase family 90 [Paracoccus sp. WLY502]
MTPGPLFFHISPEGCGEARLARLFRRNGHAAVCHDNGRLAEDILFAKASGGDPLTRWPGTVLFSGLYRHAPHWRPPLEAWRHFPWLADRFPRARFILAQRAPGDWILDRLNRDGGAAARCHAHHRNCDPADLPALWEADWHAHQAAVEAFFGDDPCLIRVDLDRETPADLAARLDPMLPLPDAGWQQGWFPTPGDPSHVGAAGVSSCGKTEQVDLSYVDRVADFCLGRRELGVGQGGLSEYFSTWDGRNIVRDRHGSRRRMAVLDNVAVSAPDRPFKLIRAEAVINDALRLARPMPLRIDMEDSRWFGSPQGDPLAAPTLCHNRRRGATNAVLWPLPDQHAIGLPGFDPAAVPDPIPWEDKLDRVVWRGMISGSERTGGVRPGAASHVLLRDLAAAGDDPGGRQAAWNRLSNTNRLAFVRQWFDHPDFDLGVVMAWGFRQFATDPLLAPYCTPRQDRGFFHRFRYQLCMTGYDHGSNFIAAIDSQSVLLAEEDGWEVFYSSCFQPWKHYIPLERYCADIAEKLAWARENPEQCKAMSAAARAEAALLRHLPTRRATMARILDGLAAAG